MQRRNRLAWVLGILLAMPGISWAQGFNGAITGVVKDSSGAVVPDAALTLRNEKTDQTVATTVSGPEGEFAFRNLNPAMYTVEAIKDGFQTVTHPKIEVTLSSHTAGGNRRCPSRGPRRRSRSSAAPRC